MAQRIMALEIDGDWVRAAVAERSWNTFGLIGLFENQRAAYDTARENMAVTEASVKVAQQAVIGVEGDLQHAEGGEIVADVVVAVAVLAAQLAGQGREDALAGEGKQAAVGDLVEAVAEGVVGA